MEISQPMVDFTPLLLLDVFVLSCCGDATLGNTASGTSSGRGFVHESSNEMNPSAECAVLPSSDSKLLNAELLRFPGALSGAASPADTQTKGEHKKRHTSTFAAHSATYLSNQRMDCLLSRREVPRFLPRVDSKPDRMLQKRLN